MKYIIEHMEPQMYPWCIIEYRHISEIVGKNDLIFTNVKRGHEKIKEFGKIYNESIHELIDYEKDNKDNKNNKNNASNNKNEQLKIKSNEICLLDPSAEKTLETNDNKNFKYLLFGGILGDFPRRRRTRKLSPITTNKRNLGNKQMSTDTAVLVSKMIMKGEKFENIKFQDKISLEIDECSSVDLPFRYVIENGKPIIPDGLVAYLKRRKTF
jgi:ribosome biogenesis SPOUT family RNA methylase Rps3